MMNAPYEKEFVFHDGRRAKNLLELSIVLDTIEEREFGSFVNAYKNDFANWTEHVLSDANFASSLRSTLSFSRTKELLHQKIHESTVAEDNYGGNNYNNSPDYPKKKSLFNIFRQENNSPLVEVRTPIQKLPEPEHRSIQMLPETSEYRREESLWRVKEKKSDTPILNPAGHESDAVKRRNLFISDDPPKTRDASINKKDNALRRWYEFKKKEWSEKKNKLAEEKKNVPAEEHDGYTNILWILIYGALVLVIIALVIFQFILK